MRVVFSKNAFTRVYWKLREASTRIVLNYGGSGSGKSYAQAQHELIKAIRQKHNILVIRKWRVTLNDSCVKLMRSLLEEWGLEDYYDYHESHKDLTLFNGSVILFRGIDDPEKLKSIYGVTRIWVEEASELDEEDHRELNRRLRGKDIEQINYTFNPVSERHWLKELHDTHQNLTAIHSTYKDNQFIDEEYKNELEALAGSEGTYNDYRIYALGQWGKLKEGNEFYHAFTGENIKNHSYDPELPLHITYDFNVNPYMSLLVIQVSDEEIRVVDEITPRNPNNNTEAVTRQFRQKYGDHSSGLYLYGDPSGKAEDTRQKAGHNDFTIVKSILEDMAPVDKVLQKAPPVAQRGLFMNSLLKGWEGWRIVVNEDCVVTIDDLQFVKQDLDGTKLKQKEKDKQTGVRYEMYGHTSDALDYFICSALKKVWSRYLRGGKSPKFVRTTRERAF